MIKIVLADDHDLFAEGLASLLDSEDGLDLSFLAKNGKELLEYLSQNSADVILMDISMPLLDGIEASKYILENYPAMKVIMLTMSNKATVIEKLVDIGVHGYLLKTTAKTELLMAINMVTSGQMYFAHEVTLKILAQKKKLSNKTFSLTKREKEIVEFICMGFTSIEIADKLFVSKFTIDSHRKNIVSKTGCKNAAQLQNWARKNDLIP